MENSAVKINELESTIKGYKEIVESSANTASTKADIALDKVDIATEKAGIATEKLQKYQQPYFQTYRLHRTRIDAISHP